jgi:hypothetical protein
MLSQLKKRAYTESLEDYQLKKRAYTESFEDYLSGPGYKRVKISDPIETVQHE